MDVDSAGPTGRVDRRKRNERGERAREAHGSLRPGISAGSVRGVSARTFQTGAQKVAKATGPGQRTKNARRDAAGPAKRAGPRIDVEDMQMSFPTPSR